MGWHGRKQVHIFSYHFALLQVVFVKNSKFSPCTSSDLLDFHLSSCQLWQVLTHPFSCHSSAPQPHISFPPNCDRLEQNETHINTCLRLFTSRQNKIKYIADCVCVCGSMSSCMHESLFLQIFPLIFIVKNCSSLQPVSRSAKEPAKQQSYKQDDANNKM